jgi:hypothetical protein
MPAWVLLLFAVSAALRKKGFSEPVAYLLTGAGAALVSGALIGIGMSRLSEDSLKPSVTLDQVQRDKTADDDYSHSCAGHDCANDASLIFFLQQLSVRPLFAARGSRNPA